MHDWQRDRHNAEEYLLLAAQSACQRNERELRLSVATLWVLLAHSDEEMDDLLARRDTTDAAKPTGPGLVPDPRTFVSGNRRRAGTETRRPSGVDPGRLLHFPDCRFDFGRSHPVRAGFEHVNLSTDVSKPLIRH